MAASYTYVVRHTVTSSIKLTEAQVLGVTDPAVPLPPELLDPETGDPLAALKTTSILANTNR